MNSPNQILPRQQVQNQFDHAASTYDNVAWLQRKMGDALLKLIAKADLSGTPIIDLGCGTGELLRKLESLGHEHLTGLDISEKMIDVAKEKTEQVTFLQADLESIPADDESYFGAVSNAAIQWCDPHVAAGEIHRVLQPSGFVFLNSFVSGTLSQWHDAFVSNGLESRVHPLAAPTEMEAAFQSAEFYPIAVQQFKETTSFRSIESMFASIKQLGATNAMASRSKRMSRSEYETLKQHFASMLEDRGRLELDFTWVQIVAKKD